MIESNMEWKVWIANVMRIRPKGNEYIESKRGIQVAKLCFDFNREDFNWHRSDIDTFWIDVQLFVKYKLSDDDILFICKQHPGTENYQKHSTERNAFAEMMRVIEKLRKLKLNPPFQAEKIL